MFKYAPRLAAVAAIVPIALALSAVPGHADTDQGVTLTGTATCNADSGGDATWTLHWTIDNQASHEVADALPLSGGVAPQSTDFDDITVSSAVQSGLVTADITSNFPDPVPARETATANYAPVPNAVGDVTLDISWTDTQVDGSNTATVHLDGSCVVPVVATTAAPTTAPPAVKTAVAAAPAFTG